MKFQLSLALLLQAIGSGKSEQDSSLRSPEHRRLDYEKLWLYEPRTLITDHAAIDLDLHSIKEQLAIGTSTSYLAAEKVYRQGAHSKSTAKLKLEDPLEIDIPKGATVLGVTYKGANEVKGMTMQEAKIGESMIYVQYAVTHIQESYVNCQVGGSLSPNNEGCFAEVGNISLPQQEKNLPYVYSVTEDNVNFRTIQGFSLDAEEKMNECKYCAYPAYKRFIEYYGNVDYGDHIITSAFNGRTTEMDKGNMNFAIYGMEAQSEIIQKAMAYINVWMYVIRELEDAIYDCKEGCTSGTCYEDPGVSAWDEAVAFYTGSRHALDGHGNLLFELADKRCTGFKTCGKSGKEVTGTSLVNHAIFRHFMDGQRRLVTKDCEAARRVKEKIETLMLIPLIQGTIRYAHIIDGEETIGYNEKHGAEGAIFAMAVLPMIHSCSRTDAEIIYNNMKVRNEPDVDFKAVKSAFERNYKCLNLKCHEIGGVYDDVLGQYKTDGIPCGHSEIQLSDKQKQLGMAIGISIAGILVVGILVCVVGRVSEKKIEAMSEPQGQQEPEITITENHELS